MTHLERAALDRVSGGAGGAPNVTDVRTKNGQTYHTERSDFAYCEDTVQRNCNQANTSFLWGTDKQAAGQCVVDTLPKACPPSLSQPGQ